MDAMVVGGNISEKANVLDKKHVKSSETIDFHWKYKKKKKKSVYPLILFYSYSKQQAQKCQRTNVIIVFLKGVAIILVVGHQK